MQISPVIAMRVATAWGFSILDTIVRSFGGRVTVESRAETGTAFTLHFPA